MLTDQQFIAGILQLLLCKNRKCLGFSEEMECNCNWKMNRLEVIACADRVIGLNLKDEELDEISDELDDLFGKEN